MKANDTRTCPLCQKMFPAAELYLHIVREPTDIRRFTHEVIRIEYPAWREEDGACATCWRHYAETGRLAKVIAELPAAIQANAS